MATKPGAEQFVLLPPRGMRAELDGASPSVMTFLTTLHGAALSVTRAMPAVGRALKMRGHVLDSVSVVHYYPAVAPRPRVATGTKAAGALAKKRRLRCTLFLRGIALPLRERQSWPSQNLRRRWGTAPTSLASLGRAEPLPAAFEGWRRVWSCGATVFSGRASLQHRTTPSSRPLTALSPMETGHRLAARRESQFRISARPISTTLFTPSSAIDFTPYLLLDAFPFSLPLRLLTGRDPVA